MFKMTNHIVMLACAVMLLAGCSQEEAEKVTGHVAVVDLDRIASGLGRDKVMNEKVAGFIERQQENINRMRDDLKKNIEEAEKKLGKKPKKSEKESFAKLTQQFEHKLRQEIALAERDAKQLRTKLIREFREEVQSVAAKVATNEGFTLVYIKQPAMLHIDPDVDISNTVVTAMKGG